MGTVSHTARCTRITVRACQTNARERTQHSTTSLHTGHVFFVVSQVSISEAWKICAQGKRRYSSPTLKGARQMEQTCSPCRSASTRLHRAKGITDSTAADTPVGTSSSCASISYESSSSATPSEIPMADAAEAVLDLREKRHGAFTHTTQCSQARHGRSSRLTSTNNPMFSRQHNHTATRI